jgi:lipid A 3-O-deacylase
LRKLRVEAADWKRSSAEYELNFSFNLNRNKQLYFYSSKRKKISNYNSSCIVYAGMMRRIYFYTILFFCFCPHIISAQAIDNTASYRNIDSNKYFRINYENDFFAGTDRDYTQGIYIEKVKHSFSKFPLAKLLWHPKNDSLKYGIAIEDDGYTPNIISTAAIEYGDRPYASDLFLKTFVIAVNADTHERISTSLSTGVIGPWAGGEGMQKAIHHWIHYTQPLGWDNQIANDAVLNYQLNFEKELLSIEDHFSFSSFTSIRAGTLSDKATAGATIMVGNFHSPFDDVHHATRKIQWFLYAQPVINFVGYDATLQGGLFDYASLYTISAADIERLTLQYRLGATLTFKRLYLEYYRTGNTKEFTETIYHRTGGIEVGFGF